MISDLIEPLIRNSEWLLDKVHTGKLCRHPKGHFLELRIDCQPYISPSQDYGWCHSQTTSISSWSFGPEQGVGPHLELLWVEQMICDPSQWETQHWSNSCETPHRPRWSPEPLFHSGYNAFQFLRVFLGHIWSDATQSPFFCGRTKTKRWWVCWDFGHSRRVIQSKNWSFGEGSLLWPSPAPFILGTQNQNWF